MRRQDWAILLCVPSVVAALAAFVGRSVTWTTLFSVVALASGIAARRWSHSRPGPMPHAWNWLLRFPRGPHSPKNLIQILGPSEGERILEVGPGIGIHTIPIAKSIAPSGRIDAIDIQPAMIQDLVALAEREGLSNVTVTCGDATELSYPDATFDAIYFVSVLGETPNQDAVLDELRRVIKPNGRLVIGEMAIDPDFIRLGELQERAGRHGFVLERKRGLWLAYFARFQPA